MDKTTQGLIEEVVINAGKLLLDLKKEPKSLNFSHLEGHLKAELDYIIHNYLVDKLKKILNVPILSEEETNNFTAFQLKNFDACFVIDPIDGTSSLIHGFKGYVNQVAYVEKGVPMYSCVYAPEYNHLYTAAKNEGAYLNGKRIKTKRNSKIVFIDNYPIPSGAISEIMKKFDQPKYIECGSIGLKICHVAEGMADIFYKDVTVRDWDIIPPLLVLQEAGGFFCTTTWEDVTLFRNDDFSHQGIIATSDRNMVF